MASDKMIEAIQGAIAEQLGEEATGVLKNLLDDKTETERKLSVAETKIESLKTEEESLKNHVKSLDRTIEDYKAKIEEADVILSREAEVLQRELRLETDRALAAAEKERYALQSVYALTEKVFSPSVITRIKNTESAVAVPGYTNPDPNCSYMNTQPFVDRMPVTETETETEG